MTRIGRLVAGVGATFLALLATVAVFLAVKALIAGPFAAVLISVATLAFFGVLWAALYTWAVDGAFVLNRTRRPR